MGRYDDISEDRLRADLVRFAELVIRLDRDDALLVSPADLQTLLGELRRKLFAWEIRCSRHLDPESSEGDESALSGTDDGGDTPEGGGGQASALRIVREAMEREAELRRELGSDPQPPLDSDSD